MRRLMAALTSSVAGKLTVPADVTALGPALCEAMAERRGRPVLLKVVAIPPEIGVTGMWLAKQDADLVVVEENTEPGHKLVILGHELWHMEAGHCGHHLPGAAVAARALPGAEAGWAEAFTAVAARTHFEDGHESEAEEFGLLLGSRFRTWLPGHRTPASRTEVEGRIEASLSYRRGGMQGG
ncbi:toxin-antitoxin system, toxin component [Streptomyces sp. NPDC051567]|uniref:toxin-antitoxin system, toxin component n=1 Tax=Streptomyces sp. NPDC051567 TaxID=3365660 RepID=UPI0037B8E373